MLHKQSYSQSRLLTGTKMTITLLRIDCPKPVVAHFVHQAVKKYGGALLVHPEFPLGRVVIMLLYVSPTVRAPTDTHHPQEFVDVCDATLS